MEVIKITVIRPQVTVIAQNKFGTLYQTSEGWHINGDKQKFIANIKRDLHSNDLFAIINAQTVLGLMEALPEI